MAVPRLSDLVTYSGRDFTDNDWDSNCQTLISFLTSGSYDVTFGIMNATTIFGNISGATGFPTFNLTGVAGENINAGDAVRNVAGLIWKATNVSAAGITNFCGIAVNTILSGAEVEYTRFVYSDYTGLTPGATYYIGAAGAITSTKPTAYAKPIGYANSATQLFISPLTEENATFSNINITGNLCAGIASTTLGRIVTKAANDDYAFAVARPNNALAVMFGIRSNTGSFITTLDATNSVLYIESGFGGGTGGAIKLRTGNAGALVDSVNVDDSGVDILNDLGVAGLSTLARLAVTTSATVGTTLGVTGLSTLASVAITTSATIGTTLGVTGLSTLASLSVTTSATIGTTLGVTGLSTLASLAVTTSATVGTTLGVTGLSTLASVAVTTSATVGTTLSVTGTTTATAGIDAGGSGTFLKVKPLSIGTWNLSASSDTDTRNVAHGLTASQIKSVNVMFLADDTTTLLDPTKARAIATNSGIGDFYYLPITVSINGTNIILERNLLLGGVYDSTTDPFYLNTNWDGTVVSRGTITVEYYA